MKKKFIYCFIYFLFIFTVGMIGMRSENEDISTSLLYTLWFAIPMTISYFAELFYYKKASRAAYFIIAIINTAVLLVLLCFIGAFILYMFMELTF